MMDEQDSKKRKANFTDAEIRKLIELFSENKELLTSKLNNTNTNKKKKNKWRAITEAINNCNGCIRTPDEVKKKWKDMLARAKKDRTVLKNPPTGGGPIPPMSIYSEVVIAIFGEDSPVFVGLEGVDSSALVQTEKDHGEEEEEECSGTNLTVSSGRFKFFHKAQQ